MRVILSLLPTLSGRCRALTRRRESGFTLVETLVTMLVLLVILAAIQRFLFAGFTTYTFGQDAFEAQSRVELAQKYLDRSLREARAVKAADRGGTYVAVMTDADNNGTDELIEYKVDYTDMKLKEYVDLTPYDPSETYRFDTDPPSSNLVRTDIIADIYVPPSGHPSTADQTALLSPNSADSGRPFIFFGGDPQLSLGYTDGWETKIKGIRTYFAVDVSSSTGPQAYYLQMYISLRNIR